MAILSGNGGILVSNSHNSNSGKGIVKSGVNLDNLGNFSRMRQEFVKAAEINPDKCSEANIAQLSNLSGQLASKNELYGQETKQRLNVMRGILKTYSTAMGYLNGVAQLEQQWQQTTAQGIQRLETTQLQSMITQEQHEGFAKHLNTASKILSY